MKCSMAKTFVAGALALLFFSHVEPAHAGKPQFDTVTLTCSASGTGTAAVILSNTGWTWSGFWTITVTTGGHATAAAAHCDTAMRFSTYSEVPL